MQRVAEHLARSVEQLIYCCLRDAASLLDAQNAPHDDLLVVYLAATTCALGWQVHVRDESLASQLLTDVHSPAQYRVNGPMADVPAFYEIFGIKPGQVAVPPRFDAGGHPVGALR